MEQVRGVQEKRVSDLYRLMITGLLLSVSLVMLLSTLSYSGGAVRPAEAIETQLGIRCLDPISQNMKIGSIVNGMIIDNGKIAKFGFRNIRRGDTVKLKLLESGGKFLVTIGGQTQKFIIDNGKVKLTQ